MKFIFRFVSAKASLTLLLVLLVNSLPAQHARRMVAEWEPAVGTLIRWPLGIPSGLVVELATDDSLFVLVESYYERDQAISDFTSWGVNMNHCRFIFAATYSHWTRDWGPHYVFDEAGVAGIADPMFNGYPWVPGCNSEHDRNPKGPGTKGWEEDDAVNAVLADSFNCPLISLPIYLTGGNIMVDGHSTAVSTQQMLDESYPICDEECFREMAEDSLGISNYIITDNPEIYGIQHIDCYAKFLDEETILVKEVPDWHPEYDCVEELAHQLMNEVSCYGRPYEIVRVFCDSYGGNDVAAYTNSLILNKKVLVPLFGIGSDQQALDTYSEAMPGYEVVGFDYNSWYYYDALHCRTMGIFDRWMLRIVHKPLNDEVQVDPNLQIVAMIDDRSETGLIPDELLLHWREEGGTSWNLSTMVPATGLDSFAASLPQQVPGKVIEYYISAADSSGRSETLPRTAPEGCYSFTFIDTITGIREEPGNMLFLNLQPAVFRGSVSIVFGGPAGETALLTVYDITGNRRSVLYKGILTSEDEFVVWDGKDDKGHDLAPGMYIIRLRTSGALVVRKCLIM